MIKEIKYGVPFDIRVDNLLNGSKVSISYKAMSGDKTYEGTCVNGGFSFNGIEGITKNTICTLTYLRTARDQLATKSIDLKIKKYTLSLTSNSNIVFRDGTVTCACAGGEPETACTWNITGNAKIISSKNKFDSSGQCTCVVQGLSPFSGNAVVTASGCNETAQLTIAINNGSSVFVRLRGNYSGYYLISYGGSITSVTMHGLPAGYTGSATLSNYSIPARAGDHSFLWNGTCYWNIKNSRGEVVASGEFTRNGLRGTQDQLFYYEGFASASAYADVYVYSF